MAGEEIAGSIVYEVGAEVEPLLQGGRQVNKILTEIENALDDNIAQFKKMDTQVSATAQAVNQSVRSFSGFQNAIRQGGYQIQDFIVQVQGGQSALVALSQQGSQLLGVFGTGGAVAGALLTLGTVIVGSLIAGMDNASVSTKALTEAQKRLSDIFQISANGVVVLSDKFAKLAETSENAARAQLTMALIDANNIIKASVQSVNKLGDALGTWKAPLSAAISQMDALKARGIDVNQALKELGGTYEGNIIGLNQLNQAVNNISDSFGISADDAIKLVQALGAVRQNANPGTLAALRDVTVDLSQKYGYANKSLSEFTGKVGEYSLKSDQAKESTKLATEMLQGHKIASEADAEAIAQNTQRLQTYIQMIKDEGATIAMTARQKALYRAEQMGASDEDKKAINTSFDKIEAFKSEQAAQKESAKEARKSATAAASQAKKLETQSDRNASILEEYRQKAALSADSTADLSREQAILAARQKLTNPTPQQIAQVERDAAAAWDKAAALKAQNAVPILKENADYAAQRKALESLKGQKDANGQLILSQEQYNQASEKLEQDHQVALAKIRAQQVVTPQQSAKGEVDPVQRLANQHAQELALIQQFETQKGQITQRGLELMNAANTEYEQARIAAQWEIFRNQSQANELLAASVDGFQSGATNAITGLINRTQSLQEAFANIGTTILGSVVGALVEMGMQWVKSQLMGQAAAAASLASTMAQATVAASAWAPAAISASIATMGSAAAVGQTAYAGSLLAAKGMAVAGARYNGGPVDAGSMYRVGEKGKPEIFQASNGSQYMIPGDNGRVISNRDMQGSGSGGSVIQQEVHFHIETTGGIDDATMAKMAQMMKQVSLSTIRDQQRPNGLLRRS
ncbi:phage tail length tape measure family protein [Enterobacter hormaechei]|uniref:phage tail length tape measure family protein n=1 Tax=Enterobacter hormaechei TaxID=158836 RepID=UPI002FD18CF1